MKPHPRQPMTTRRSTIDPKTGDYRMTSVCQMAQDEGWAHGRYQRAQDAIVTIENAKNLAFQGMYAEGGLVWYRFHDQTNTDRQADMDHWTLLADARMIEMRNRSMA